jgi:hypothetical protein
MASTKPTKGTLMQGTELRQALERSGYGVRGAAQEMGIDESTLRSYLSGRAKMPELVELVARCGLEHNLDPSTTSAKYTLATKGADYQLQLGRYFIPATVVSIRGDEVTIKATVAEIARQTVSQSR